MRFAAILFLVLLHEHWNILSVNSGIFILFLIVAIIFDGLEVIAKIEGKK